MLIGVPLLTGGLVEEQRAQDEIELMKSPTICENSRKLADGKGNVEQRLTRWGEQKIEEQQHKREQAKRERAQEELGEIRRFQALQAISPVTRGKEDLKLELMERRGGGGSPQRPKRVGVAVSPQQLVRVVCPEGRGDGDSVTATTASGEEVEVNVPPGVEPGEHFVVQLL